MTRRVRIGGIVVSVVAALFLVEVGLERYFGPEGCVEVANSGAEPVEDLRLTYGGREAVIPKVAAGSSVKVHFRAGGAHTLALKFRQKGNPLGAYELPGFDPGQLARDGNRQVLRIGTGEVERYQDDGDPSPVGGLMGRAWQGFTDKVEDELRGR